MPKPSPLAELRFFFVFFAESVTKLGRDETDVEDGVTNAHDDNGRSRDREAIIDEDFIV